MKYLKLFAAFIEQLTLYENEYDDNDTTTMAEGLRESIENGESSLDDDRTATNLRFLIPLMAVEGYVVDFE